MSEYPFSATEPAPSVTHCQAGQDGCRGDRTFDDLGGGVVACTLEFCSYITGLLDKREGRDAGGTQ